MSSLRLALVSSLLMVAIACGGNYSPPPTSPSPTPAPTPAPAPAPTPTAPTPRRARARADARARAGARATPAARASARADARARARATDASARADGSHRDPRGRPIAGKQSLHSRRTERCAGHDGDMDEHRFHFPHVDVGCRGVGLGNRRTRPTVFIRVSDRRNLSVPLRDSPGNGRNGCRSLTVGYPYVTDR